ncbi:MAG: uroporphyrinogen decarboxylase family protein [candidate division KSB1 bacterium]|nr:uroporphyrinogen decarboxylase family protein [candidate division KSB1 bacterium]
MTSRERLLTALARGKPDRLPATLHDWMKYYLDHYLGGIDALEAFRRFGLDASIYVSPFLDMESPQWRVTEEVVEERPGYRRWLRTITTPEGSFVAVHEADEYTSWVADYPLKHPEQIRWIEKYMPVPRLDKGLVAAWRERVRDDGIVRGVLPYHQPGCWQDACQWYGTQQMIMATFDDPAWVHEFLRILRDKKLAFVEQYKGSAYDLIEGGGGDASTTVISPTIFEHFVAPYDREVHRALHAVGMRVVYHTCGGMMPILEKIVGLDVDAIETLTPREIGGDVDLAAAKRRVGQYVCMIGGMNQTHGFTYGTPEKVREMVLKNFAAAGPGGGYILSTCDHFFHAPVENLQAYADAARECVY